MNDEMNAPGSSASVSESHEHAPPLWNNTISIIGMVLAAFAVILLLTFALFSIVSPSSNPYVDIVGYLILPGMLVVGLLITPLGLLFKSWRVRRKDPTQRLSVRFRFDLSDPRQRRVAKGVIIATFIFLPVVGVSSYHGYHYTDSSAFCAEACHSVMQPEATTYHQSPHARVPCAECHIGEGAGWFVKSKLSGTRQVLAMWRESYSRPIAPAIRHLRPARETCENCHWPQKFYGAQLKEIPHFASDEKNTRRDINMLLKIGGGNAASGPVQGIHWHMALANRIDYIATDSVLQVIPWVRMTDPVGRVRIYRSDGKPSSDPPPTGQMRTVDCMDCHNRPAHEFLSPQEAVNRALDGGKIDTTLPYVKREAIRALVEEYPDRDTADREIGASITGFYEKNYPDVWSDRRASVNQAIDAVRGVYNTHFFPYMKVDWRTYPDNVGHLYSGGCFRCHDGKHVAQNGQVLSNGCDLCHTFLNTVPTSKGKTGLAEGPFQHPFDLTGAHQNVRCDQCHSGAAQPSQTCAECHVNEATFIRGETPEFAKFAIEPDPMADTVDCESCHDVSEPVDLETMNDTCLDCHDDEPDKFDGLAARWKEEYEKLLKGVDETPESKAILEKLRRSRPLHNMNATRKILKALSGDHESTADAPSDSS